MEGLIKQIRVIFYGEEENKEQKSRVIRDRRISSRRTRSFRGDNQKGQSWVRRQFSRSRSRDSVEMDREEFRTAVAAAAFAVTSIENKEHEKGSISDSGSISWKSSGSLEKVSSRPEIDENLPGEVHPPTPTSVNTERDDKEPRKTIGSTSSIEKTPSFIAEKQSDEKTNKKEPETKLGEADIWEKSEMEKIKRRFEKLKTRIFEWEKKKKMKAKNKLTRKEGGLERKRARALQDFKSKMKAIDKISGGERSRVEKNQTKKEIRVKEKANKIRSTGKIPKTTCFCC